MPNRGTTSHWTSSPRLVLNSCSVAPRNRSRCALVPEDGSKAGVPGDGSKLSSPGDGAARRPSWKAMLKEWLRQAHSRSKGMLNHYYLKCTLDRLFAVRDIDHGSISWWPTDCPSYVHWYGALYPNRCSRVRLNEDEKFQILCAIYRKLNATIHRTTFTDALAQTCWMMKETRNTLATA